MNNPHLCCLDVPQLCLLSRLPLRIGICSGRQDKGLSKSTPMLNLHTLYTQRPFSAPAQLTEHQHRSLDHPPVHFGPAQSARHRTPANQNFHERATWVANCACAKARLKQQLEVGGRGPVESQQSSSTKHCLFYSCRCKTFVCLSVVVVGWASVTSWRLASRRGIKCPSWRGGRVLQERKE